MPSPFLPRLKQGTQGPSNITSHHFYKKIILQPLTFIMTQGCQSVNSLFDRKRKTRCLVCHYFIPLSISHSLVSAAGRRLNVVLKHAAAAMNTGSRTDWSIPPLLSCFIVSRCDWSSQDCVSFGQKADTCKIPESQISPLIVSLWPRSLHFYEFYCIQVAVWPCFFTGKHSSSFVSEHM